MATMPRSLTLYEFLLEAELIHYYNPLKNGLKVHSVSQLKYVKDEDLSELGMSKPEQRRLHKYFQKYFPQTYLRKIKNIILSKNKEEGDRTSMCIIDSTVDRSTIRVPSKHIIPFENIVLNRQLGVGEFGVVQQGVWTNEDGDRTQVAIKCLSEERMQKNHMEFLKEAAIMHTIDHEHIVRLYGVVLETNALMLVTELAPLRSLLECLKEPALRSSFPILTLCEFALQICDGMQYLESKKLIHRDLAARNILVFAKDKVKISDFGLSRALGVGKDYYQTNFNVNLKLPIAWCAPECINYLRFTSASDVWAYGVTLWEMFSYGFQPWAALTGQQILEAIDEPNFQRLEQPELCPKEYYALMLNCWQHDANKRPKFSEIFQLLPKCAPEQVQPAQDYVGRGLTSRPSFLRLDGKSSIYASKRRLKVDMISEPQGDCKHTGHVGLDGAFFGDISFLGDKYHQLPKQIVNPYKPQDDKENISPTLTTLSDSSDKTPLLINIKSSPSADNWSDVFTEKDDIDALVGQYNDKKLYGFGNECKSSGISPDHEYHKISDDDDDDFGLMDNAKFGSLDFGPSLVDEVLMALGSTKCEVENFEPKANDTAVKAEIRDVSTKVSREGSKKKHAVVKPISAADQHTLDSAIAMAKELASKSMLDLDYKSENETPTESPRTPNSPLKRKFSFKFKTSPKADRRNFSEEAEAIPDIQDIITEEAKEAYNSLVEKGQVSAKNPTASPPVTVKPVSSLINNRNLMRKNSVPPSISPSADSSDHEAEMAEASPLRMLRSGVPVRPKFRGNRHGIPGSGRAATPHTAMVARLAANCIATNETRTSLGSPPPPPPSSAKNAISTALAKADVTSSHHNGLKPEDGGPDPRNDDLSDSSSTTTSASCTDASDSISNPLPLPPRDRTKPLPSLKHHQRKHPLLFPGSSAENSHCLMKQVSCPDVPSHSSASFTTQVERRASEGGTPGLFLEPKSMSPAESLNPSLVCNSHTPTSAPQPPPKPSRTFNLDESFETQIQVEIDNLDCAPDPDVLAMYKGGDHVSCEDLLEFALDKPNARRTQGRSRGTDSDEVRIMQKVLADENLTSDECLLALNETDWDIHKAIKYIKLQCVIKLHGIPTGNSKQTLMKCNWDVRQAANYLLATHNATENTTEV